MTAIVLHGLSELGLSFLTRKAIERNNIETVEDLQKVKELTNLRRIGKGRAREIEMALAKFNGTFPPSFAMRVSEDSDIPDTYGLGTQESSDNDTMSVIAKIANSDALAFDMKKKLISLIINQ